MPFSVCNIFISLSEWLLSKIFKVLISFSVWANKEVSCRTSSTEFLKMVPESIPHRYVAVKAFGHVQMGEN